MTYCKVIVCSANTKRHIRTGTEWPNHNQDLSSLNDFNGMYIELIANELRYDAGVQMDTIIVMNGGIPLLSIFHNTRTRNGRIIVDTRDNKGGGFGGFNYAYQNYKYDYYLFTEEDLFVGGDVYYKKLLDIFDVTTGFVGLIGVDAGMKYPTHCHGAVGLTSREVLEDVFVGDLPNHEGDWDRDRAIIKGEIPFTNEIFKAGYELKQYGGDSWANKLITPYYNIRKLYDLH